MNVARESEKQVVSLFDNLIDAGIRAVCLVNQQDNRQVRFESLAQNKAGLWQRAF